jgi:uncharacterized protein
MRRVNKQCVEVPARIMSEPKELSIKVNERESVTALLYAASKNNRVGVTIILGHGAGANQMSGFMQQYAAGLAGRGLDAMTFNFLYTEQKRKVPDPKARLEACYRAVIEAAAGDSQLKKNRLVIGGKSMGGRIASQVAAADASRLSGLVFLGYPLHPPGRPDKLRDEHLPDIKVPMLFCQGARDAFGTEAEIRELVKRLGLPAEMYVIDGGDHSFKVPKSAGVPQTQVHENVMDQIAEWVQTV